MQLYYTIYTHKMFNKRPISAVIWLFFKVEILELNLNESLLIHLVKIEIKIKVQNFQNVPKILDLNIQKQKIFLQNSSRSKDILSVAIRIIIFKSPRSCNADQISLTIFL